MLLLWQSTAPPPANNRNYTKAESLQHFGPLWEIGCTSRCRGGSLYLTVRVHETTTVGGWVLSITALGSTGTTALSSALRSAVALGTIVVHKLIDLCILFLSDINVSSFT